MFCSRRQQLFTDYLERVQALAVETELLLKAGEKERETVGNDSPFRVEHSREEVKIVLRGQERGNHRLVVEESRIQCEIARLAVESHVLNHGC
jgi:hypothetical protein